MRVRDWQLKMEEFTLERKSKPFSWGTNDCATFASDYVLAVTGEDPALPELREHRTAREAIRAIRSHGGLEAIATSALGEPVHVSQSSLGDIALVRVGKRMALGVVMMNWVFGPGPNGYTHVPLESATKAWRI